MVLCVLYDMPGLMEDTLVWEPGSFWRISTESIVLLRGSSLIERYVSLGLWEMSTYIPKCSVMFA